MLRPAGFLDVGLLGAVLLGMAACAAATGPARPRVVMMASTIGPIDAGIVAALEDAFRRRTGIDVRHAGAGTGAALDMAKTGSFDLVMVHARRLEDQFVADGFGVDRYGESLFFPNAAEWRRRHGSS
jgi:tungstate transport system substrate-binding protein